MTTSDEIVAIAHTLILVDPDAYERLHRIALEVRRLERFADEVVAEAHEDERRTRGLKPVGEIIEPFLERAIRLSSREKL